MKPSVVVGLNLNKCCLKRIVLLYTFSKERYLKREREYLNGCISIGFLVEMHQTILYMKKIAQYWHKRFDILLPQIFVHKLKFLTCQVRGWFVISQGVRLVTDQTLTGHKLDTWIFSAWMICCCHNLWVYLIVLLHTSQK